MKIFRPFNTIPVCFLIISASISCNDTPEKKDANTPATSQPTGIKAILVDERKALMEEKSKMQESLKATRKQLQGLQKKAKDAAHVLSAQSDTLPAKKHK